MVASNTLPLVPEESIVHVASAPAIGRTKVRRSLKRVATASFVSVHANFHGHQEEDRADVDSHGFFSSAWPRLKNSTRINMAANTFGGQTLHARLQHFNNLTRTEFGKHLLQESLEKSIGLGNNITHGEIIAMYDGTDLEDKAYCIVFVLKLGISLVSYGCCTVDAKHFICAVCDDLELPLNRIDIVHSKLTCSFGTSSSHLLEYTEGMQCDKMIATTRMAKHVPCCMSCADAPSAIMVLDEIGERQQPYGQLIQMLAFWIFSAGAAMTFRMGTIHDALSAGLVALFVIFTVVLCNLNSHLAQLSHFMAPVSIGIGASFVWKFVANQALACRVPIWYLAAVINFLPGGQLVYGAYEFEFNSVVNGTTRLVRALLQCMVLAIGLTVGWQIFGHNLAVAEAGGNVGALASMPPSVECKDAAFEESHWKLYLGILNIPMGFLMLLQMNIRVRDMLGPLAVSYCCTLLGGALNYSGLVEFPQVVVNFLTVFLGGNMAMLLEGLNEVPGIVTVLPIVGFLAPGSGTLKSIIQTLHNNNGDNIAKIEDLWGGLILEGVSLSLGLHLAAAIWRPINLRRLRARREGRELHRPHVERSEGNSIDA